jgi:hypothetical protein
MKPEKILADYARYYVVLQKMGETPLSETPTIESLGVSKAQLQSAYKDIKETRFDGSFIDYLCLVSLRYVVFSVGAEIFENEEKYKSDISNFLRLVIRKPDIFFKEAGIKTDKNFFTKLAGLYYEYYHKKPIKSSK